jgi:hypothetical protein
MSDDLPALIGRYQIRSVLGGGAMGVIYKAHDPVIDRAVAIKLIRADLLSSAEREQYLERFRHEAQAAGRCMHPNIVGIYDFALHDGNPFLAMEYVQGISLSEALARGARFGVAEAVYIARQILEALACAHALGIVHRDVKPANVLLVAGGGVKVTDFGISRLEASHLTQTGSVVGTPSYMSPEQCRGDPVDARSDIFSAGAVLYEMLSGARPFAGRTLTQVMHQVLHEEAPDLRAKVPSLPDGVYLALQRAMRKRSQERFPSAKAMAEALREAIRGSGVGAATIESTVVIADCPGAAAHAPMAQEQPAGQFDPQVLDSLERRLAQHIGPIAKRLVQSATRRAQTMEELRGLLAHNIEAAAARELFLTETAALARSTLGSGITRTTVAFASNPAISPEQAEQVQRDLARFLGPIARVLVKRTVGSARSLRDLRERLAEHIDQPADRAAFLAGS